MNSTNGLEGRNPCSIGSQDLEDELRNAGLEDRQFLTARIALCEEGLRRFPADDDLMTENRRRALAESYNELGETGKAEALFREWLKLDPRWGWGWIGWSDCHWFTRAERKDLKRSEQILREGLAIADVRDRADVVKRLADLCREQGRDEEAKEFRRPLSELSNIPAMLRRTSSPVTTGAAKAGRNDPCPCGSGKKFKKCCGA